jgi:hypothetical protein
VTYGLQLFGPDGSLRLDSDETFTRLVAVHSFAWDFTGTVSVPDFDDQKGLFFVNSVLAKVDYVSKVTLPDSHTPLRAYQDSLSAVDGSFPTVHWNNTTKVLTLSPVVWPPGWSTYDPSDYSIVFIHYR